MVEGTASTIKGRHLFNNIDSVRSSMRPEARVRGVITEGGAAPNVVPDRTAADFYIRYPDAVYLALVREFSSRSPSLTHHPILIGRYRTCKLTGPMASM